LLHPAERATRLLDHRHGPAQADRLADENLQPVLPETAPPAEPLPGFQVMKAERLEPKGSILLELNSGPGPSRILFARMINRITLAQRSLSRDPIEYL